MAKRDIIVIGASAGGFNALKQIIRDLPLNLNASIFIVWHMSPDMRSFLPEILNRIGTIKVVHTHELLSKDKLIDKAGVKA